MDDDEKILAASRYEETLQIIKIFVCEFRTELYAFIGILAAAGILAVIKGHIGLGILLLIFAITIARRVYLWRATANSKEILQILKMLQDEFKPELIVLFWTLFTIGFLIAFFVNAVLGSFFIVLSLLIAKRLLLWK